MDQKKIPAEPAAAVAAVRRVVERMRARERQLWASTRPSIGVFAAALDLNGYASALEVAIGDCPPPKGRERP